MDVVSIDRGTSATKALVVADGGPVRGGAGAPVRELGPDALAHRTEVKTVDDATEG